MKQIGQHKAVIINTYFEIYWASTDCLDNYAFSLRPTNGDIDRLKKDAYINARTFCNI